MPFWEQLLLVLGLWLLVALTIGVTAGRLLKTSRKLLEGDATERVARAITKFLNEVKDDGIIMYRDRQSGQIKSEEALGFPDPCIICLEYGYADDEDLRRDFITIRDRYIPLCAHHKRFVAQCLQDGISLDHGPDPPSE